MTSLGGFCCARTGLASRTSPNAAPLRKLLMIGSLLLPLSASPFFLSVPLEASPFGRDQAKVGLAVFVGDIPLLHHGGYTLGKAVGWDHLIRVRGTAVGQHRPFTESSVVVAASVQVHRRPVRHLCPVHRSPMVDPNSDSSRSGVSATGKRTRGVSHA